jgi:hypothetical protein
MAQLRVEFDALGFGVPERVAAVKVAEVLDPLPRDMQREILRAIWAERAEVPA